MYEKAQNVSVKDLEIICGTRDLKDIVLIDNCAKCYLKQIENGIPILPYAGAENEKVLLLLQSYLMSKIKDCQDVREIIKVDFRI